MLGPESRLKFPVELVEAMAALARFDSLELFVSAVDTFDSKEACETCLNNPDVSRAVVHLERYLGLQLIERRARGARLTDAGVALHDRAKKCLGDFTLASNTVARPAR